MYILRPGCIWDMNREMIWFQTPQKLHQHISKYNFSVWVKESIFSPLTPPLGGLSGWRWSVRPGRRWVTGSGGEWGSIYSEGLASISRLSSHYKGLELTTLIISLTEFCQLTASYQVNVYHQIFEWKLFQQAEPALVTVPYRVQSVE